MRCLLPALILLSATFSARAELRTEQVDYEQDGQSLSGYLAYDDAIVGRRPGVLVVHEWWGLNDYAKRRAGELAREGYMALALDMYGEGRNTDHPEEATAWSSAVRKNAEVAQGRFEAAYEALANHPLTKAGKMAAIGYCFGGHVVLSMAQAGVDLDAVASFHGAIPTDPVKADGVKAKVLVCHGAEDGFIPEDHIRTFQKNMTAAGADWQWVAYGGAKHSFTNPEADSRGMDGLAYNRSADLRSWKAMLTLFEEAFAE